MNRRGFLKNLGIGATVVAVPSVVYSSTKTPTFRTNGLYTEDELNQYQKDMIKMIDEFTHYTNIAWREKDSSKLPINLYRSFFEQMSRQYAYSQRYEEYDLFSHIDRGFESLLKYELLNDDYSKSRQTLSSWKACYRQPKDEWMKKTSFTDFNNKFIELATEVNLQNKIKKFRD